MASRRPNLVLFCRLVNRFSLKIEIVAVGTLHDTLKPTRSFTMSGLDMKRGKRMFSWRGPRGSAYLTLRALTNRVIQARVAALYLSGVGTPPRRKEMWGNHEETELTSAGTGRTVWGGGGGYSEQSSALKKASAMYPKIRFTRDNDHLTFGLVEWENECKCSRTDNIEIWRTCCKYTDW